MLRREALELGATEEDLKIVDGLDDNDFVNKEDEELLEFGEVKGAKDLSKNDIESFIKQMGFPKGDQTINDDEVSEVESEEEVDDDDDDDEEEEEEEVEEEQEEQVKASSTKSKEDASNRKSQEKKQEPEPKKQPESKEAQRQEIRKMTEVSSGDLLMPVRLDWYSFQDELDVPVLDEKLTKEDIAELYEKAKQLTEEENSIYYKEFSKKSSQKKFLTEILTGGTLSDKISSLTLMLQEAPIHNLKSLSTLLGFCAKKSRTAALQAINSLKDLLISGLLPADRKLQFFKSRALNKNLSDEQLILYYFEDDLKNKVFNLVEILERLSHDSVVHVKKNTVSHIFDMLTARPEQEQNLLSIGINKLGDIDNKVAAQTSYTILQLEQAHPAMKETIVRAVIDFLNRNYENYNSKYYSLLTLNQTILTRKETDLANKLIVAYFSLFKKILVTQQEFQKDEKVDEIGSVEGRKSKSKKNVKKGKNGGVSIKQVEKTKDEIKEEQSTKLFSAVLTGLNRAFPFSDLPNELYLEHLDSLYKIAHSSNFNTNIQSLSLIHHIVSKQGLDSSRYYKSLYESLLDERLVNSSKQGIYLNLLYKSIKDDLNVERVLAFVKRIVQVCSSWLNIGSVCGMLFLLTQLEKAQPAIRTLLGSELEVVEPENSYDMNKRDPRFTNADKTALWEIIYFMNHFHPSVKLYAERLFNGADEGSEPLVKPDLGLHTLAHFLDKFVYKNPKTAGSTKGSSIMQPLNGSQTMSLLMKSSNLNKQPDVPVNMKDWFNRNVEDVQPDEKFFYEFFKNKDSKAKVSTEGEGEGEDSDLDEDEVWKALVTSRPDIDGEGDNISEEDISFDEEEFSDDELVDALKGELSSEEELEEALEEAQEDEESAEDVQKEEDDFHNFDDDAGSESESDGETFAMFEEDADEMVASDEDVELDNSKKRKRPDESSSKSKKSRKQKMKDLPVFASAEDYAEYLQSDSE